MILGLNYFPSKAKLGFNVDAWEETKCTGVKKENFET